MRSLRVLTAVAFTAALLTLGPSAQAAVEVSWSFVSEFPVSHGTALITVGTNCYDPETNLATPGQATITLTLTQGNRTVTKTQSFDCEGAQGVTLAFRGFHAGAATIDDLTVTACDADGCFTREFPFTSPVPITLVRA
jgi:hypothetical protein